MNNDQSTAKEFVNRVLLFYLLSLNGITKYMEVIFYLCCWNICIISDNSVRFPQSYLMCANFLALNSLLLDQAWLNVQSQCVPLNVALLRSLSRGLTRPQKMWLEVHKNKPHFPECYCHAVTDGKLSVSYYSVIFNVFKIRAQCWANEMSYISYLFGNWSYKWIHIYGGCRLRSNIIRCKY
jgi:hypothetical protein